MISIDELKNLLSYDPKNGKFHWKVRRSNSVPAGREAFTARKTSGHLHGLIHRKTYMAHRVAWALHFGVWPDNDIDHINGIRDDNRIINLRLVDKAENAKNRRPNSGKVSGLPHGVSLKKNGRFFAQIQNQGKVMHLGYFSSVADASCAYEEARKRLGFHENHGAILKAYEDQQ